MLLSSWVQPRVRRAGRIMVIAAAVLVLSALSGARTAGNAASAGLPNEVVIGGLFSLTGEWSSLGVASQVALDLAAADINAEFTTAGSPLRVRVAVEDTRLIPETAQERLPLLVAQGARIVVGPQSSAEVRVLKPWADANGVLLISQGSTASSLSIPGDNILRFVPDDTHEIEALVALLLQDGIRAIVPVWRADTGNQGLAASARRLFAAAGGAVSAGVEYSAEAHDFAAEAASVSEQVRQAQAQYGAGAVAVFLAAFDEAVGLFHLAESDPVLSAVRWYGSDGVAQSEVLLADARAAAFAERVGFPCPNLGLEPSARDRWQPLVERISARTGYATDAFTLAAYDAAWVAALTYLETAPGADAATLRTTLLHIAGRYFGATGRITLNQAGDRDSGNYDFWAIRRDGGAFRWVRVARYEVSPGSPGSIRTED